VLLLHFRPLAHPALIGFWLIKGRKDNSSLAVLSLANNVGEIFKAPDALKASSQDLKKLCDNYNHSP
jgi:hypothetical protein